MIARVLLAVSQPTVATELRRELSQSDIIVKLLKGRRRLWERVGREVCDLIVISRDSVPEPVDQMIRLLRELPDSPTILMLVDEEDPEERARHMAAGCEAVLSVTLSIHSISEVCRTILVRRREEARQRIAAAGSLAQPRLADFVSNSPQMQRFMDVVRRVVNSQVSLLVLGETGVGKERLARAIHAESPCSAGPFIAVNCGALPETLLESELFGHEEGAFTGATRSRRGCFELAHRGTVFLDEIGEIPTHLQVKLLQILQEHEVRRVGGEKSVPIDVRVMAATNRDLKEEVEHGRFRRDLYYRLNVVTLTVPALRQRREDIPELTRSCIEFLRSRIGTDVDDIVDGAIEALVRYDWPGNVRELINVLERSMLLCATHRISLDDLPDEIARPEGSAVPTGEPESTGDWSGPVPPEWLARPLRDVRNRVLEGLEKTYLEGLLAVTGGRVGETARRAGIQPRSLYEKMRRHGLRKEDFKPGVKR